MPTYDYIIIGSGIAGIHTAYRLQQQGKRVLVLEKESYVGGRMSTRLVAGHRVDYGAKFVANGYKNMMALAKELGVKPVPTHLMTFSVRRHGKLYPVNLTHKLAFFGWGIISFKAKVQLIFGMLYLLVKYGLWIDPYKFETYLHLDNKSVYTDVRRIVGAEAFDYILEPLSQDVVFYGTKEFSRAPFYALLSKMLRIKTFSFPGGIGELNHKMAAELPVELNTRVISVKRTAAGVAIKALRKGKELVYQAKSAIIAVPGSRVMDILSNPPPEEKKFFPQVRYASSVQIIATANPTFFSHDRIIWTEPKDHPKFTALGVKPWHIPSVHAKVFHAALKADAYKQLMEEGNFNKNHIINLIREEFPNLKNVRIVDMQVWDFAVPEVYPGYLTKVFKFLNRKNWNNDIYFCGDYLENPSTEGALTSSVKLLEKLNAR